MTDDFRSLGDLVVMSSGKSIIPGSVGPYPVYGSNGLIGGTDQHLFDSGCILGRVGAYCGSVELSLHPFWASDNTIVITPRDPESTSLRFLYYALIAANLNSHAGGAAQPLLTQRDLRPIRIYHPSLLIQRKIAAVLSAYDDLIENNNRRIKLLEEMAQRIYREWFVDFRYPGHEAVPLVASELGLIPEGWSVRPFTDLVDVLSGGTPRTTKEEYWNGHIPFFTPRDSPNTLVVTTTEKHVTQVGLDHCNSALYQPGTVFITARGTVGKVAMAGVEMAMNQSCYAIRGQEGVSQEFVLFSLLNQVNYLKTNTGGATFDTIIVDTFRRMHVVAPPSTLDHSFGSAIEPVMQMIRNLQIATEAARNSRDLLLPRLISGDIDVTSLNIAFPEAAS